MTSIEDADQELRLAIERLKSSEDKVVELKQLVIKATKATNAARLELIAAKEKEIGELRHKLISVPAIGGSVPDDKYGILEPGGLMNTVVKNRHERGDCNGIEGNCPWCLELFQASSVGSEVPLTGPVVGTENLEDTSPTSVRVIPPIRPKLFTDTGNVPIFKDVANELPGVMGPHNKAEATPEHPFFARRATESEGC
jgi:hypothetical protein